MTDKQDKKFISLCKQIAKLMKELEPEHPQVQFFIDDGTPYLIDAPDNDADTRLEEHIISRGCYWHRSGGGGF